MTAPRVEVDLAKVGHNARTLVADLGAKGIAVTAVTKATVGSAEVARTLVDAGVARLGDSRVENLEALHRSGVRADTVLLRSPMISQVDRIVAVASSSCNTEAVVVDALSEAAGRQGRTHGVLLMVEMGDLREGVMPADLAGLVTRVTALPHLRLDGVGTNLACQSGMAPDETNMGRLSELVTDVEAQTGVSIDRVSGGNSANLDWASSGAPVGRIDDLRLGEAILLGREALRRRPLDGLHLDAFTIVAEVIEVQVKPTLPWGRMTSTAFGTTERAGDRGEVAQAIVALGRQDVAPDGLVPPAGMEVLGTSSDHLVLDVGSQVVAVGDELAFQPDYPALLQAMTSPFVAEVVTHRGGPRSSGHCRTRVETRSAAPPVRPPARPRSRGAS
jgi:predicted amino acid racemase